MHKFFALTAVMATLLLSACSVETESSKLEEEVAFAHEASDLMVDESVEYGQLPNGLRYAVRSNATPTKTATLLMRIDTGSINEKEDTRGLAHFLEHMAFNGSENIPEGEMIKTLEKFGLAFGPDTNASTSFFETTYQLELPEVDEGLVNQTLMIMRETADNLTLEAEAIDRERGVILAEKRARSSPGFDAFLDSLDFYLGDTLIPKRLPIGTDETIKTVTAEQFRRFYEGYYRPENTFIVFVGDFDTDFAAGKIEEYFGDWSGDGVALDLRDIEALPPKSKRVGYYTNPEIQTSLSLSTLQKVEDRADTKANRRLGFVESLGNRILSRRLGELSRTTDAPYISASVGTSNLFEAAKISTLSIQPEKGEWAKALKGAEPLLRQALEFGFSEAELKEQIVNTRKSLEVSAQTAPTRRTPRLARGIMGAFSNDNVITDPAQDLERFNSYADNISLEDVNEAFRAQWEGLETAPQLYLSTSEIIEEAEAKLELALSEARNIQLGQRETDDELVFAYSDWGTPGQVKSRTTVEDIDFETVTFENGVKLNIKQTPYQKDSLSISVAMGSGEFFMPEDSPGLRIFAPNALNLGGLKAHKVDDIRKLMVGKSVGVSQNFGIDRRYLSGGTVPSDLDDQLNLMTAYAMSPGFRPEAKAQYDKYIKSFYPTLDSTPGGVASRDISRLIRSGDERYGYPSETDMLSVETSDFADWLAPYLDNSPIEIGIVGDVSPDTAIEAVARTFGALPSRLTEFESLPEEDLKLTFPKGSLRSVKLSHAGDDNTALLRVYWPAPDGRDVKTSREVSMVTTVFRLQLTEVLREEEGASYSPSAFSYTPRNFPNYGYVGVSLEVAPEDIDRISAKVDDIAAELRAGNISADLFERAMKPALENIETSLESNRYWMRVISEAQSDEERLSRHRSRSEMYEAMSVEDLQARAKNLFDPQKAYRVQILPET